MIADRYIYLLLSLGFFVPALLMALRKNWWKYVIAAGLMGAAAGIFAELLYFADYWRPPTVRGIAVHSIEDALFGFGVTALALCIYGFFEHACPEQWSFNRRHAVHIALLMAVVLGGWLLLVKGLGLNSMIASYVTFLFTPTFLLVRRPQLWRQMVVTGVALVLIAGMIYAVLFGMLDRAYIDNYFSLAGRPWNPALFGFYPLTELAWYFLWGFSASGLYPYVFDTKGKKVSA